MIARAGEAWESSQQHEFYSHEAKKGVRKLRPSRRTRFRKLPAATRFPTMQLVPPRWWLRRCTTDHRSPERWPPDIAADDRLLENFPGCWGFHHYPSYPWCPVLHEKEPGREIWSHFSNRGLQNQILRDQVDPEKHYVGHSVFHSARLCRLGVQWQGSMIKTEFKPGALKNLLSCRSSDYNVIDSVFPEYKSWGVLLASWPQTWSIQAFL